MRKRQRKKLNKKKNKILWKAFSSEKGRTHLGKVMCDYFHEEYYKNAICSLHIPEKYLKGD